MSGNKDKQKHLPMIGVGPLCVSVMIGLTVAGILLSKLGLIPVLHMAVLKIPLAAAGVMLILLGTVMYANALFGAKIDRHITSNTLAQTGVYAYVRNPIYSAFMMYCAAALCFADNVYLFVLLPVCWGWMTVLMKHTEEKWLFNLYGEEYTAYCRKVNRCIPWFGKR